MTRSSFCCFPSTHRRIFPIHPSFRVIALAEPPVAGSSSQQWLSPELLTMFFFHSVRPLAKVEEAAVIHGMVCIQSLTLQAMSNSTLYCICLQRNVPNSCLFFSFVFHIHPHSGSPPTMPLFCAPIHSDFAKVCQCVEHAERRLLYFHGVILLPKVQI